MIEIDEITKTYNAGRPTQFEALKAVDLRIDTPSVSVLKGPSGSGKTTLLSVIGGMTRPTSGRVRLQGKEITGLPERFAAETRRKTFGFIFQNYNLIRGLTVLENVLIPAVPLGRKHREMREQALALLERFRMEGKAGQRVEHLSGGEMQRTAIARALINEPEVVVADEPTAHLDSTLAGILMESLAHLTLEGKTVLVASHDPLVCDADFVHHVIAMRDGTVVGEERRS